MRKLTAEVHQQRMVESGIDLLEPVINIRTHVRVRCRTCAHEWQVRPRDVYAGKGCKKCGYAKVSKLRSLPLNQHLKRIKDRGCELLGEFKNVNTKVHLRCLTCMHEWKSYPFDLYQGKGCPICGIKKRAEKRVLPRSSYQERFLSHNIELVGHVKHSLTPVLLRCITCKHEWKGTPATILRGDAGCPKCNSSRGERLVAEWLDQHSISYIRQKWFNTCRDQRPLPFDFFCPNHQLLIEFHGEQHYRPFVFGSSKRNAMEHFAYTQKHDQIKSDWAQQAGLTLIIVPYTHIDKIDDILSHHFTSSNASVP